MNPTPPPAYDRLVEELLEAINRGRGFEEIFAAVYDRLQGVVPYHRIAVGLLDEAGEKLSLVALRSDGEPALKLGYSDPIAGSTLDELLRTGRPRIINDLPDYLARKPSSRSTRLIVREGMRSNLTLPLLAGGRPFGVVFFSSREANAYADGHARLLKRLAGHLAISLEKARLIDALHASNRELVEANALKERFLETLQQEVRRQTRELRASEARYRLLVEVGRAANASLDVREVFRAAATELHAAFGCELASLVLASPSGEGAGFALEWGETIRWVSPPAGVPNTAAGWVLENRRARVARRLEEAHPFAEDRWLLARGYRGSVALPLLCRGVPAGVLGLAARDADRLDSWDLGTLGEIAAVLAVALDNAGAYSQIAELKARLEQENAYLRSAAQASPAFALLSDTPGLEGVCRAVEQVAAADSTVLITGETGTGKELVARAVHELSPRRENLFVRVNCAALPAHLVPSELFGHEAGAFTGALKRRVGRFELASGGSILLDEIAEVSPEMQVLLLRVLQERVIERVGGGEPIPVDVRVIAATNRDLPAAVADGSFRADLFYRLNVFPIRVPPLRERPEAVPRLVEHFLNRFNERLHRSVRRVDPATLDRLLAYPWPGNVRELENLVERGVIVSDGETLHIDPSWLAGPPSAPAADAPEPAGSWAERERRTIREALERSGGKVYGPGGAAERLGLKPTTLYGKMRKLGIRRPDAR